MEEQKLFFHKYVYVFYLDEQRDARIMKDLKYVNINDSYNVKDVVMPLEEYINKPIAWDIIHNGATFQVIFHKEISPFCYVKISIFFWRSSSVCHLFLEHIYCDVWENLRTLEEEPHIKKKKNSL